MVDDNNDDEDVGRELENIEKVLPLERTGKSNGLCSSTASCYRLKFYGMVEERD